jgi:hypothetical protein
MENKNEIIVNDGWFNLHNINLISEIQTIKDTQTTILNEINNLKNLILNTQSNLKNLESRSLEKSPTVSDSDLNKNISIETEIKDLLQKENPQEFIETKKDSLGIFKNTFGDVITPRFLKNPGGSLRVSDSFLKNSEAELTQNGFLKTPLGSPQGFFKTLDEHKILEERKKNLLIRSKIPFHFYSYSLNNLTDINTFNNIKMHSDFKNKSET